MKTKWWALVLIILTTLCTSSAALLNKKGATMLELTLQGTIFNPFLVAGFSLLVVGAVFLMLSLKGGDVSVIYPVIASSYIWVTIGSAVFFSETINNFKIIGVVFIVLGVIIVNLGQKEEFLKAVGVK